MVSFFGFCYYVFPPVELFKKFEEINILRVIDLMRAVIEYSIREPKIISLSKFIPFSFEIAHGKLKFCYLNVVKTVFSNVNQNFL